MNKRTPLIAPNQLPCLKEINMPFPSRLRAVMAAILLVTTTIPAYAVLERVGPTSTAPSMGGYPAWYQDTTGLTMEFCDPKNQLEVDGGWCLLLPANVPVVPEVFPTSFFNEHFYHAATGLMTAANGGKAKLMVALEGAFASPQVIPGDQVVFARIRATLTNLAVSGTYRVIHPYGEELVNGVAGTRLLYTQDVGITPGNFSGALSSRLGPFLLPAATPGGAELAPVAGPAGLYIADPARIGPITGSTLPDFIDSTGALRNHNIFRIEGPVGSGIGGPGIDFIETTDFTLMGRIYTGTLAGRMAVNRASYTRDAKGQKVDVFANAFETIQARIPPNPQPAPALPQLSFFDAPCAGTVDPATGEILPPYSAPAGAVQTPMVADGSNFWGEAQLAALPSAVCVEDGSTIPPVYVPQNVSDLVTITSANYDPIGQALSVTAASSDTAVPPTLTLAFGSRLVDLVAGKASVAPLVAPPDRITVRSSALGSTDYQVKVAASNPPAITSAPILTATADLSYAYKVIAADPDGGPLVFTLDQAPAGMTIAPASAFAAWISWRPTTAQAGAQAVIVRVTDPTGQFATQSYSINVAANSPPVANNDAYAMIKGTTLNVAAAGVLANDTDPDAVDTLIATNYTTPGAGGILTGNADGSFSYTPPATFTGLTSFAYLARDNHGLASTTAGFVSIAVSANRAPTTVADAAATTVDTPLVINVLGNDSDPDTAIDATNHIDPATVFIPLTGKPSNGGTVTVNLDGTINYTPAPGFVGIETFSYAVKDTYITPAISKAAVVSVTVQ